MWLNIEFESKLVFPIPCDRIFVVDPVPNWTGCRFRPNLTRQIWVR